MDKKRILELELILKRTPDGRHIGENLLEKIKTSLESAEEFKDFTRCKLCGLQMDSNSFPAGCPNCGCKDTEALEDRNI